MKWPWDKEEAERERQEAREALANTREQAAHIRRKQSESHSLFQRIHRLKAENHIAEAVRNLMEGRT